MIIVGSLVVITKKSKRAIDLWLTFKKKTPLLKCSCSCVNKGIFQVDGIFKENILMLHSIDTAKIVIAPIEDVILAIES